MDVTELSIPLLSTLFNLKKKKKNVKQTNRRIQEQNKRCIFSVHF